MAIHAVFSNELGQRWMKLLFQKIVDLIAESSSSSSFVYSDNRSEILVVVQEFMEYMLKKIELCPM